MAQRCASNWDGYCDQYLYEGQTNPSGFSVVNPNFLAEVAKKKYCHLNTSAPGAHCAMECESFTPQGQSSVQICDTVGSQNWLDTKDEYDLAGDFPQSARLNPISPIYMGECPQICDSPPPGSLGEDDRVLNLCIEHGACTPILMDLAYNVVKNNIPVTNSAFNKIISYAKDDVAFNPNTAVKIAKSFGIPSNVAVDVWNEHDE